MSEVKALNGIVWFGVKHATNISQPVYRLISKFQYEWLESYESIDWWLANSEQKLTVTDRRILITHWVGEAHTRLQWEEYNKTRYRCYEKTGCLIIADGSNDAKINPEGLHDYVVTKTLPVQVAEEAIECPVPDAAPEPDDVIVNDDDRFEAENVSNDER